MQSIRRSLSFAGLSLMAMALTFAACTDDGRSPLVPEPPVIAPPTSGGPREGVAVQCRATIATREVVCGAPQPSAGGAQLDAVVIGGQHQYVELISSNIVLTDNPVTPEADSIFGFDVRIQNILRQPVDGRRQKMGTSDPVGYAPDPEGIRIFFTSLTGQGANASLLNADDVGTFTTANQEYFQYNAVLDSGDVSSPKQWQILLSPGATSFDFTVLVNTPLPFREGWIDLTPNVVGLAPTETQTLTATIRSFVGNADPSKSIATWSSSNEAVATVDASGTVTAVGVGTVKITASTASGRETGSATITVSNAPAVADTTIDAISNVTIPATGLQDRITDQDGGAHVVAATLATAKGGIARLQADGSFDYLSRSGFVGQDTIHYQVTDEVTTRSGRVIVNVSGAKYWYVKADATGDGRDRFPFGSFASAKDSADAGDVILVLGSAMEGPVTLESGQSLIGQGIAAPITETVNGAPVTVLASGTMPTITRTGAGATVALADNNTLKGIRINAPSGAAISGSAFGTLTANEVRVYATGPALHLTNGSINATLDSLSSTGSAAEGLFLSNVGGTLVAGGGSIASAGTVGVSITGGVLTATYPGSIGSSGQGALISGHAGGVLSFAGNVTAPGGVAVSGTSAGNVTFGGTITTAGGIAVSGTSGVAKVEFKRKVTESGQGISITGNSGGMVAFADSLVLSGKGIGIGPNLGGSIEFAGTHKSLATGANVAVSISGDASAVLFGGGGLAITTNGARGFNVQGGGTVQVTGPNNTISTTGAEAVFIANASSGVSGITFRNVTATGAANAISLNTLGGTGFQVTGDGSAGSGGTLSASNTAVVVSTADSVRLNSVAITAPNGITGAGFGGLGLQSASITATAGAALTLTTGRLHVSDVAVSATNGAALSTSGVALDGALTSLTATTNTGSAVSLVNSTGSLNVPTGTIAVSGAGGGTAVSVSGSTGVTFAFGGSVTQDANAALLSVAGGHTGTLTFSNGTLTANNGSGLQITDGDGVYNFNGTLDLSGGDAGIDLGAGSAGDVNVVPAGGHTAQILSPTGAAVAAAGGSADLTFNGTITQDNAVALLDVTGNHSGTLTFAAGTVNANAGTGLQLTNADGAYNFNGTLDLSGGDAGIDVGSLSSGAVNVNPAAGHTASIISPTGAAIAIAGGSADLTFNGNVTQATASQPLLSVAGAHTGDVSFPTGTLTATNGTGLQFNDADGTYAFNGTLSLSNSVGGADAGIDVIGGSGGTFTFNANSAVTNPANQAINIQNGAGTLAFTYSGSFTKNNNAVTGILVQNNAGGSIAFNGDRTTETKVLSTTTAAAVSMVNNGTASILFSGGGLNITTTTGNGFSATGSGTVQVTGAENTVAAGTGTAVNIQNVNVGSSGVVFKSVSANGGANGIVLNTTGATGGGFGVTGDGVTVGSGGTIQGTTGGDGAVAGNGVYLNATRNVSLSFMNFSGHGNHAIRGLEVTGATLDRVRITGTNGSNVSGEGEGSVYFHGLYGAASITRSYIEGGVLDNVRVVNLSGTLDRLVMTSDTIGHNGNVGSDGVFLQADGSAVFKVTVQNSRFTGSVGDQTQMSVRGTSNVDFVYTGNVLSNNHPARLPQNFGVAISSGGSGAGYSPTLTYAVNNNVINDAGSTGISIGKGGVGAGSFTGTVNGNTIGTAGVGNSGSAQGSAIVVDIVGGGSHNSTITNNTIRQFTNYGILAQSGNATAGGGQGYLTLTIQGNNIAEPSPAAASALFPTSGIRVVAGTNSGDNHKNCVVLGGTLAAQKNTVTGTGTNGGLDLRLFQRFVTLMGVPGYAGANNDNTAMNAFLTARNTLSTVSGTNNTATGGPGFSGSCPA